MIASLLTWNEVLRAIFFASVAAAVALVFVPDLDEDDDTEIDE